MTSHAEVIEAFLERENEPWSASNFHMETAPDGYTAYLIGDDRLVFAKREPINRFTAYVGYVPYGYSMPVTRASSWNHIDRRYLNAQGTRVRRKITNWSSSDSAPMNVQVSVRRNNPPPTIKHFDEDFGIFEEVEYEPIESV